MEWSPLPWLQSQHEQMVNQLVRWANINSGTENLSGILQMHHELRQAFAPLNAEFDSIDVPFAQKLNDRGELEEQPIAPALRWMKRADREQTVFLCIHTDTVYGEDHSFQDCQFHSDHRINGPGVADAKGGILIMLYALLAFEQSPLADRIGFEVLINSDEEIGSPGTSQYFKECAQRHRFGLLYEPTLPDGTMVAQRKGSGNFSIAVRGRAAHAGREFHLGRNAIVELCRVAGEINGLNQQRSDLTVNVGRILGGGAVNIVPDLAIAHLNARVESNACGEWLMQQLSSILEQANVRAEQQEIENQSDGDEALESMRLELHGSLTSPPKIPDQRIKQLQQAIESSGKTLSQEVAWTSTGGTCDGNKLFACGLPNVDTLGVRGGAIHSIDEFVLTDSLVERAALTAQLLHDFAQGAFSIEAE